jgi:hypothetical protein
VSAAARITFLSIYVCVCGAGCEKYNITSLQRTSPGGVLVFLARSSLATHTCDDYCVCVSLSSDGPRRGRHKGAPPSTDFALCAASEPPVNNERRGRIAPVRAMRSRESPSVIDGMCTQLDNKTRGSHADGNINLHHTHAFTLKRFWSDAPTHPPEI